MMELVAIAGQYGVVGLVLLACAYYVTKHDNACTKAHEKIMSDAKEEREQWRLMTSVQHQEAISVSEKAAEALNAHTSILTEIATIIRRLK